MNPLRGETPPNTGQTTGDDLDDLLSLDDEEASSLDSMVDGDRQLTTDSDAIDGGLNDSDLGSERDMSDDEEGDSETADASTI